MAERTVVHVLPRLGAGGPTTSLLYEGGWASRNRTGWSHELLVLEPGGSREAVLRALRQRTRVHAAPDPERESQVLGGADVVVVHYWNTPSMWQFLKRSRGLNWRWILYCHVNGVRRPQLLPQWLAQAPCHLVLTSPHAKAMREDGAVSVVPALVDLEQLGPPQPSNGAVVHVGTLTVFKIDPAFVDLHRLALAAGSRVEVVGAGSDESRFAALAGPQWRWYGFDPRPWQRLAGGRVFSAPIRATATSSGEKTVQEAGLLGIPVVAYRDSPVAHLIIDQVTGLLARDRDDFAEMLTGDLPSRNRVIEAAAQLHAPEHKASELARIYDAVAEDGPRPVPDPGGLPAWVRWQTAGALRPGSAPPSLSELAESDETIAAFQSLASEGGRAQFLNAYPDLA
jgi:hypothetical protein